MRKRNDVASAFSRTATLKRRVMRLALVAPVLLTIAAPATAQPCPPIQVRNPAGNYIVPGVQGDIPYSGNLALDAYVQQGSTRPPSIFFLILHNLIDRTRKFITVDVGPRSAEAFGSAELKPLPQWTMCRGSPGKSRR